MEETEKKEQPQAEEVVTETETATDTPGSEETVDPVAALAEALTLKEEAEKKVLSLENEKEALLAKLSVAISQQQRLQQDFDNFRKRTRAEQAEAKDKMTAEVAKEFLPVVDNCERALSHMAKDAAGAAYVEGFALLHKQLLKVLADLGVEEIAAEGAVFDPHIHEAVMQVPSADLPEETVAVVLQKGYKLKEIVLRPAKVQVVGG